MSWNLSNDRPIYMQILEILQMRIVSGYYKQGDRLPSVRELAAEAEVNPNTMQKAMSEMERTGIITTLRTSGRVITEDTQMIAGLRSQMAHEQIDEFLGKMEKLGFERNEIVELMRDEIKNPEGDNK